MNRKLFFTAWLLVLAVMGWAQPNNSGTYYQNADGKKGAALKTALASIINPHTQRTYNQLWTDFEKTDKKANGKVWDMYSVKREFTFGTDQAGNYSNEGDVYNREHSFPKSWFNDEYPMYSDLFHLYPTDAKVNGMRSNHPFGEVGNVTWSSYNKFSKLGDARSDLGYSGTVFEPNDEYKGDFARTYFYMVTCYESKIKSWNCVMLDGKTYPGFSSWALKMLLKWAKNDPVSEKEINRNNAVYGIQNNRNPFIDYPGLEQYIWGTATDKAFSYDHYVEPEGGGVNPVVTVATPVISPNAGSYNDYVDVTITCATDGAKIYYTTGGSNPSEQSTEYTGSFRLTETSTVKAIAVKDGTSSSIATAAYTITTGGQGGETPSSCEIEINNAFFGLSSSGTIAKTIDEDYVGTANGVTVVYALGTGGQRYATETEIRVYTGNTLTVSVENGTMKKIEITKGKNTSALECNVGSITDFVWTGNAKKVEFTSTKNTSITKIKVSTGGDTGINVPTASGKRTVYNLRGERVANPTHGIYVVDGRKVIY